MEGNADSFSFYQVKDIVSESDDSDNIVENSDEESENNVCKYNYSISSIPRKKKIQVISSDEDEVPTEEHSLPVQAVVSAASSDFPHQNLQMCAPKCQPTVGNPLTLKNLSKDLPPAAASSCPNIAEKGLASSYSSVKESRFSVVQSVRPNTSSVQGARSDIQSLPKVPSSTNHYNLSTGACTTSVKKDTSTFSTKSMNTASENKCNEAIVTSDTDDGVTSREQELQEKVLRLIKERDKMKTILRSSNLTALPDHGARLQMQVDLYEKEIRTIKSELETSRLSSAAIPTARSNSVSSHLNKPFPSISFPQQPASRSLGTKALQNLRVERSLTNDALEQLHGSLKSCPSEEMLADDPHGLKTGVQLMPHQKRALSWLMWRETQNPRGGVLADDMGLGKTLTMISLILKSKQEKQGVEDSSDSEEEIEKENWHTSNGRNEEKGGTLVICPASLLSQWEEEVHSKCRRGLLEVEVYHGQQRDKPRRLVKRDVVITTYNLVRTEAGIISGQKGNTNTSHKIASKKGSLFQIKWERIILDEAHVVRNHKSQTSIAVCLLSARHRWALTGTPIHNKELDFYALLKFLRCSPFDDYLVWRRWVDNKNASGQQRLNTVVNSIMLRRTKAQLQENGAIKCLPEKHFQLIYIHLDEEEFKVYQKVLIFSKTLFAQFLHQRAEREQLMEVRYGQSNKPTYEQDPNLNKPFGELAAWQQKLASMPNIKSFEILVLLLRLRQLCCHPSLITAMLEKEVCEADGIEDEYGTDMDLLTQFSNLGLENNPSLSSDNSATSAKNNILRLDNPVFERDRVSSKMRAMLEKLQERIVDSGDKAIVVSQWTTMLDIVGDHLQKHGISCEKLTGAVPVKERMAIVTNFNQSSRGPSVLLLSLTAGGVGLNLVGANHLFLFDLHWNPQLEAQACDRIYRVGQKKAVYIYKFVCEETIEQRIKMLQDSKLSVATNVLSGAHKVGTNKLSLNDLKMLFSM